MFLSFYFIWFLGAYNMGGSPEPTVQRIKNMVYMNHTNEAEANAKSREEYLGENNNFMTPGDTLETCIGYSDN